MRVLRKALARFLEEDIGRGDITSRILPRQRISARIICKERAVVAGLPEARILFDLAGCRARALVKEGRYVRPMTTIMTVSGNAKSILAAERTVLNVLMRMSGIATETRKFVEEVRKTNPRIRIAATRKTSPGFRVFDKRAVRVGGGETHRMRLDEMILIKDNHLAVMGSVTKSVRAARRMRGPKVKIEVEVRSLQEAVDAIKAGADMIMLDNLTPARVHSIVRALERKNLRRRTTVEVSGGITHANIRKYASANIDLISIGSITHSVRSIDISLEITGRG